jgi:ABC-type antimicrobial peptide transport system permease subunit
MFVVVRTTGDPRNSIEPIRRQLAPLDKKPIYHVVTLDEYLTESVAKPRFVTLLLTGFAGLALLLACVGIYGVISYVVVQRRHEIGVRIALGAKPNDVLLSVLGRGLVLTFFGITIGLTAAAGLVRLLSSLLYGVRATDPATFAIAPLLILAVAMVASYIPARRASHVDPLVALRCE